MSGDGRGVSKIVCVLLFMSAFQGAKPSKGRLNGLHTGLNRHQIFFFGSQELVCLSNVFVGQLLNRFLATACFIFRNLFVFQQFLMWSFASRRTLRIDTRPSSASLRTTLIRSLRRSSVNIGIGTRIKSPTEAGFRPKLESRIAFLNF